MTNHRAVVKSVVTELESTEPQRLAIEQGTWAVAEDGGGEIDLVRKEK